ncbi:MAG: ORF6N domain-containing protein [Paludibacter sp.]|nr:ORF6N domain-containing protein [Paludibacter sp.]
MKQNFLIQAAKRNIERFPIQYRFQLTELEKNELVTICDRFEVLKHSSSLPYVFTEQGVAMLSAVLRSETAVRVSILIMDAFVEMRKVLNQHAGLFQRMDKVENKLLENDTKFEQVFKALESKEVNVESGVFFEGQVFDAWTFVSDLVRSAKSSLILIDNYIDDTVLKLLDKRVFGVTASIYTKTISRQLATDMLKHNTQYAPIEMHEMKLAHDRFLIIDRTELYHIGASLKDLGNKWFAFSRFEKGTIDMLNKLGNMK